MEQGALSYRPYEERDFDALVQLIDQVWDYQAVGSVRLARCLAELDLLRYLRVRSYSQVVELDGQLVGVLLGGRTDTPADPRYNGLLKRALRGLHSCPGGWLLLWLDRLVDRMGRSLRKRCGKTFDAQLLYFVLRQDCQGQGVGKRLYRDFCSAMAAQGAESFYVLTDTVSNFRFYERMGMTRLAERAVRLAVWQAGGTRFYLYEGRCGQQAVGE